jgi:subtilisin family serine protease
MRKNWFRLFGLLVVLSMLISPFSEQASVAQDSKPGNFPVAFEGLTAEKGISDNVNGVSETGLYVVRLSDPALASYTGGIAGLVATSPEATGMPKLDASTPAALAYMNYLNQKQTQFTAALDRSLGRSVEVAFNYVGVLNAVAIRVSHEEAEKIASFPGVAAVYGDTLREMETEVGPVLIGAPSIWNGNSGAGVASRGEGIIIGVIDSGINFAHPSFAATDGDGYTHTNPYGAGVYRGWCATNPGFCNAKLIAAYGLNPVGGSPEDMDGHGSHTASTAGGNAHTATFDVGPTTYNIDIQGVAPRANIVAYKVCDPSCPSTASINAVNSAILNDQVDVLNYSISGSDSPWTDAVDLAFLDASNAGIFVAASAGNSGPGPSTVAKTGPWNAAVAASTINRVIANTVDVTGPTTPPALQGMAAVPGENSSILANINAPIRYNPANNDGCTTFSPGYFSGALALIQRGGCTFTVKVTNAFNAGAIGVVVFNSVGGPPINMGGLSGTPPAVMLDLADGIALRDYIVANPSATVVINAATSYLINNDWEDIVAGFSSRGPSQFELLKPDFIAPGVNTLAAVAAEGADPVQYGFYQGTSMSSPHVAGAAALMVSLRPTWSPAEIKSALATTAVGGLVKEDGVTPADPFDVGSGRLDLSLASTVGLVFDESGPNYVSANPAIGGDPKSLNQPSVVNYSCATSCSWTRTVTAVVNGTWSATTNAPVGMALIVTPNTFSLTAGGTQQLTITANVASLPLNQWAFGSITLSTNATWPTTMTPVADTNIPVVVQSAAETPVMSVSPSSLGSSQAPGTITSKLLTIANLGTAELTWQIAEAPLPVAVTLSIASPEAVDAPIMLSVDDGVGENAIGLTAGGEFLWLNRFSLSAGSFPIQLERVDVMFGYPGSTGGVNVGELVDIYLYEDADGDPSNGAIHRASLTNQTVQAVNGTTWSTYNLAAPVTFSGPGDILIAVVNRTAGVAAGTFPAVIDQTPPSQQRSWAGFGAIPGDPPVLPLPTFGVIDSFGLSGNWLVRGFGERQSACDNPDDVAWLSVTPSSGATAPGGSSVISVSFDSTGLAPDTYTAILCVTSNDPLTTLFEFPVSLEVLSLPAIAVDPEELSVAIPLDGQTTLTLDISSTGLEDLTWYIAEVESMTTGAGLVEIRDLPLGGDRANPYAESAMAPASILLTGSNQLSSSWSEGFDDITLLPGLGWALINNSEPLGTTNWFQGNATVFPAHNGATNSYIGANFNNTAGVGTISNWLLTPEINFKNGDTFSFWTRVPTSGGSFPDRLEVRWSGNGSSTNVGTTATSVGDFTTLLLSVNPDLTSTGYPEVWTQYTVDFSGLTGPTNGRIGFRYFVTNGGPSGSNSNYIGIDSFEYSTLCDASDISWLSVSPDSGTTAPGVTVEVDVTLNASGLAAGDYGAHLCVISNDPNKPVVTVPVELTVFEVAYLQVAHLAPFAEDASVTITLNDEPALTNFGYGDSTEYIELPAGEYDVAVFPTGSGVAAIEATVTLMAETYYTAIAVGDGDNQGLELILLEDDLTAPAAGKFHLRLGHLAPFASGAGVLADIRLQDGTLILGGLNFGDVTAFLPLDAGEYDLKITTLGGAVTLIDPLPLTFAAGDIISAFASGDGLNQDLGVFALPAGVEGFFLPLYVEPEGFTLYLPFIAKNFIP